MKHLLIIVVLLTAIPVFAVPGWLIGFSVGVGVQVIPWTRNHVIMPPLLTAKHTIQKTVRPIPQDKIDKMNKKAEKARKKDEARKTGS